MVRIVKFIMCMLMIMFFTKEYEVEGLWNYILYVVLALTTTWFVWAFVL